LHFSGTEGLLVWNDNWVTFLDTMLQMQIIASASKELRLPTRIRSVRVDPVGHEKFITTLEDGTKGILPVLPRELRPTLNSVEEIGRILSRLFYMCVLSCVRKFKSSPKRTNNVKGISVKFP